MEEEIALQIIRVRLFSRFYRIPDNFEENIVEYMAIMISIIVKE